MTQGANTLSATGGSGQTALSWPGDGAVRSMLTWDLRINPGVNNAPMLPLYGTNNGLSFLFRVRPYLKSTSNTATSRATSNERYWTLFFWSNRSLTDTQPGGNAIFQWHSGQPDTYAGMHPYPDGGAGAPFGIPQHPEVSVLSNDFTDTDASGNPVEWTWGDWVWCGGTLFRDGLNSGNFHHVFYYDLERATGDQITVDLSTGSGWTSGGNPPVPSITMGQSPFKTYTGDESFCGEIAQIHIFDALLTRANFVSEIGSPGASGKQIWYRNTSPDSTMADQSGQAHHPFWVGTAASVISI